MDQENTSEALPPNTPDAEAPYSMPPKKKPNPLLFLLFLIVLFVFALGIGAVFIYRIIQTVPNNLYDAITYTPTPTPYQFQVDLTPEPIQQWRTYSSTNYGVTFKHPSRWQVNEHFKNKDALVAFKIVDPFYMIFEKIPTRGRTQTDIQPITINGITWYQPDVEKAADKEGVFCELYNCDQMTYGKYSSYKDGYRYTFYYPKDVQQVMVNLLTTFTITQ